MKTKYKILLAVGLVIFAIICIFGGQALADREQEKQLAEWQAQQTVSPTSEPSETPKVSQSPEAVPDVTATPEADSSPEAVATNTPTSNTDTGTEAEAGNKKGEDTVIVDEDGNQTIIPDFEHQAEKADKLTKPDELGAEANMNGGGGYIPTKDGVYYGDDYDYGETETPAPSPTPAASATPSPAPTATPKPTATPQPAATPAPSASQSTGTQLATYKIEYYEQNEDKSGYQCTKVTISDYGKVGETVTAKFPKAYDGFVFNENHPDNLISGVVTADSSLVLKAYFDRAETSSSTTQKPTATPDNDDWSDPPDYEGSESWETSPDGKWVWMEGSKTWIRSNKVAEM